MATNGLHSYIALLRGVNVGGNNKISMASLRAVFEREGFSSVSTYINSGNVLFMSEIIDASILRGQCERLIGEAFSLNITVCVVCAAAWMDAVTHVPPWWNADKDSTHNALFVIPPASAAEVCEGFGEIKPDFEKVFVYGNLIFWSVSHAAISRTRWAKIVGTAAYKSVTIRNANTTVKLAELAKQQKG